MFIELAVKEISYEHNKGNKCKYNKYLLPRRFLYILLRFQVTALTGTILRFFFVEQVIKFTSQANAESGFKEQENKTDKADDAGYRAVRINYHHKNEHGC